MPTYIAGYEIDAVINEDKTSDMDITDHPVEKGVDVTDHARLKPLVITMDCVVSDTPFGGLAERRGISLDDIGGAAALSSGPLGDYVASDVARYFIEDLQRQRKPVTLSKEWVRLDGSRGYKSYDNMMVQTIGETITAETGDTYTFKVTFKQINYVTNNRTTVRVAVPRAKKKLDKGSKATEEKKTPEQIKGTALQVLAHSIIGDGDNYKIGTGAIGGLLGGH